MNTLEYRYFLKEDYYYKIYLMRKQSFVLKEILPEIFITDIEKQQLEIAQKIFFFFILSLISLIVSLSCFGMCRYLLNSLLIYYGYLEPRSEPGYPLAWLALKTKLKRLNQIKVLKYMKYQAPIT